MSLQILVILTFLVLFSVMLVLLIRKFHRDPKVALFFIIPLTVYCLGFYLRLSGDKLVDLGLFLTDFSSFFVYILFAVCVLLGQLKYWKK